MIIINNKITCLCIKFECTSFSVAGASLYEADRRLDTLISIVTFLYGPSYDYYLGRLALSSKRHCWNIISLLLNKWHELLNSEQCYLVEVINKVFTLLNKRKN